MEHAATLRRDPLLGAPPSHLVPLCHHAHPPPPLWLPRASAARAVDRPFHATPPPRQASTAHCSGAYSGRQGEGQLAAVAGSGKHRATPPEAPGSALLATPPPLADLLQGQSDDWRIA